MLVGVVLVQFNGVGRVLELESPIEFRVHMDQVVKALFGRIGHQIGILTPDVKFESKFSGDDDINRLGPDTG